MVQQGFFFLVTLFFMLLSFNNTFGLWGFVGLGLFMLVFMLVIGIHQTRKEITVYATDEDVWAEERGFVFEGAYQVAQPLLVYRHPAGQVLAAHYVAQKVHYQFISFFTDGASLETFSHRPGFPATAGAYTQALGRADLETLWSAHLQAELLLVEHGKQPMSDVTFSEAYRDMLTRRQRAIRALPLWPLRFFTALLVRPPRRLTEEHL